jgi:glycine dehydrogenase subunit 2
MDRFSLQPAAGAHGEFTGLLVIRAHLAAKGQLHRNKVLVPDSAHGTNPSSARQAGFEVITVPSLPSGEVDVAALERLAGPDTAALMLTNPNTLGVFEARIRDMASIVHRAGGLLYYDGANMNALLGLAQPGDMGFDVVHLNLHKSFSTPHGGGGPGAGPVGVKGFLEPYLPVPRLKRVDGHLVWDHDRPQSIGRVRSFAGNFGILARAYTYIRAHGAEGMERNSRAAIINANYLKSKVRGRYREAAAGPCMHEFVVVPDEAIAHGVKVADIAKRLLDYGFHSPTLSWPIRNCLMIEPTETESRETLDRFADALLRIADEAASDPEKVRSAPHRLPVRRMDEVAAARNLDLRA